MKTTKLLILFLLFLTACNATDSRSDFYSTRAFPPPALLTMRTIYFEEGSHSLTHDQRLILEQHARWLNCHPNAAVFIEGHCDYIGEQEDKMSLSRKRAEAAALLLREAGVKNKLDLQWFGSSLPVDTAATERAHSKNRRVMFTIDAATAGENICPDLMDHLE